MSDRCYLEITIRRQDLPGFAEHVAAAPGAKWWDEEHNLDHPDLVSVGIYEANYAWYDEREAAARVGIPFLGAHADGGGYGAFAFAAVGGEMDEAPISHDGDLIIAVDEDLQPRWGVDELRAYVVRLRAVKTLFGMEASNGGTPADQQAEGPAVPVGLRAA